MDLSRLHWQILQGMEREFTNRIREFLVIGDGGEGVIMATEPDGEGFWFGEMKFGEKSRRTTEPKRLNVSNLVKMAHGTSHIVLLTRNGQMYTLGANDYGQLGQGIVNNCIYPTSQLIPGPHRFTDVQCGCWHSLALTEDGKVWAWGLNNNRQVGLASSTSHIPSLRQITELDSHRVVAIECGGRHSLALTDQGQVYGWGANDYGQLSQNKLPNQLLPVRLSFSSPITQISAGLNHSLLLAEDGLVFACGRNDFGQLGLPISISESHSLRKISGLPSISQIASHFDTNLSIAFSTKRQCFVWGDVLNQIEPPTRLQFPAIFSTIESPLSLWPTFRNTPHSVRIKDSGTQITDSCTQTTNSGTQTEIFEHSKGNSNLIPSSQFPSNPFSDRVSRFFDNPDSKPDLQFVLPEKSILAHRAVLQRSSANFTGLFSETCLQSADLPPSSPSTSLPQSNHTPHTPHITQITIPDHSYLAFYSFLRYIYTGLLQVPVDLLPDVFELSQRFECLVLQQLCLSWMLSTVSLSNCCPYYQLADRHRLTYFQSQVVKFIADHPLQVLRSAAFRSMDSKLIKKLSQFLEDLEPQPEAQVVSFMAQPIPP